MYIVLPSKNHYSTVKDLYNNPWYSLLCKYFFLDFKLKLNLFANS